MGKKVTLMLTVLVCLLCACSGGEGDQRKAGKKQGGDDATLKVATTPTLDCLPIFLAQEKGLFDANKVSVRLLTMQAQMDCQEALLKEKAQLVASDVMRVEKMRKEGKGIHYVLATNLKWQLISNRLARITDCKQMGATWTYASKCSSTMRWMPYGCLNPRLRKHDWLNTLSSSTDKNRTGNSDASPRSQKQPATAAERLK